MRVESLLEVVVVEDMFEEVVGILQVDQSLMQYKPQVDQSLLLYKLQVDQSLLL